ncbi:MAG: hypothetical protein AB7W28_09010 [Armatimonadota bacterium]
MGQTKRRLSLFHVNSGTNPDDLCPDELDQPAVTPELTPFSLLIAFGCIVLVMRRRSGK